MKEESQKEWTTFVFIAGPILMVLGLVNSSVALAVIGVVVLMSPFIVMAVAWFFLFLPGLLLIAIPVLLLVALIKYIF